MFFSTEFWLLWSTMGSLPQHGATELRRYINRALALFPDLSDMSHILRTPLDPYRAFIEPLVAWLRPRGVNLLTSALVRDIGLAPKVAAEMALSVLVYNVTRVMDIVGIKPLIASIAA